MKIKDPDVPKLIEIVFKYLNKNKYKYCIERNYEKYPHKVTGDLDLIVEEKNVKKITEGILKIAQQKKWFSYQTNISRKYSYISLVKKNFPKRFVFTIELYSEAGWKGFTYLKGKDILHTKQKYKTFWKPDPTYEAIISSIHHCLYNSEIPKKYHSRIKSFVKKNPKKFVIILSKVFGENFAKLICSNILKKKWKLFNYSFALKLRRKIILNQIIHNPYKFLKIILNGVISRLNRPEGAVIIIQKDRNNILKKIAKTLLDISFKWHIFIPPMKNLFILNDVKKIKTNLIKKTISTGGVCLIYSHFNYIKKYAFKNNLPFYYICNEKKYIKIVVNKKILLIKDNIKNIEKVAYKIWSFILMDRYNKLKNL